MWKWLWKLNGAEVDLFLYFFRLVSRAICIFRAVCLFFVCMCECNCDLCYVCCHSNRLCDRIWAMAQQLWDTGCRGRDLCWWMCGDVSVWILVTNTFTSAPIWVFLCMSVYAWHFQHIVSHSPVAWEECDMWVTAFGPNTDPMCSGFSSTSHPRSTRRGSGFFSFSFC